MLTGSFTFPFPVSPCILQEEKEGQAEGKVCLAGQVPYFISCRAWHVFKKLAVVCCLYQFISSYQLLTLYRCFILPWVEYTSNVHRAAKQGWAKRFSSYWLSFYQLSSTSYNPQQYWIFCYLLPLFPCSSELTNCMPHPFCMLHVIFYSLSSLFCPPTLCKS